jgi:hypothetical protein
VIESLAAQTEDASIVGDLARLTRRFRDLAHEAQTVARRVAGTRVTRSSFHRNVLLRR